MVGNGGNGILGISYEGIPAVQEAIKAYVQRVEAITDKITADAGEVKYEEYIRGTDQLGAIQGYIQDAVNKVHTVTEYLNKFSDALEQVKANYEAQQGTVAGNIGTAQEQEISAKTGVSGFGD